MMTERATRGIRCLIVAALLNAGSGCVGRGVVTLTDAQAGIKETAQAMTFRGVSLTNEQLRARGDSILWTNATYATQLRTRADRSAAKSDGYINLSSLVSTLGTAVAAAITHDRTAKIVAVSVAGTAALFTSFGRTSGQTEERSRGCTSDLATIQAAWEASRDRSGDELKKAFTEMATGLAKLSAKRGCASFAPDLTQ